MPPPQPMPPRKDLLARIDRCLDQFNARKVTDITEAYDYVPDAARARIGSGSYGATFRMKNKANAHEPARIVKFIEKARVANADLQVQHLCVELAVLKLVQHPNLNHGTDLLHSETTIFLVLELCEGPTPSLETRLYHLLSRAHPARMVEVPAIVESFTNETANMSAEEALAKADEIMRVESSAVAKREIPTNSDLFNCIVNNLRLHPLKASVIIKGVLQGLSHLHERNIVHRDMKTENIVLGETRKATPLKDADGNLIGVKFTEKIDVKVIDFGLVKYMNLSNFPTTPSPGCFTTSDDPFARAASDVFDNTPSSAGSHLIQHATPGIVDCTPCGTEIYCALEVLDGIVGTAFGRRKWQTSKDQLPKFDVYGAGTALYCMINGRPPFRAAKTPLREQRIKEIQQQVKFGPAYWSGSCPDEMKQFIMNLMKNDVRSRPNARQALRDPILDGVSDTFSYEVLLDGSIRNASAAQVFNNNTSTATHRSAPIPVSAPSPPISGASAAAAGGDAISTIDLEPELSTNAAASGSTDHNADLSSVSDIEHEKQEIDEIMAIMRGQEDDGDAAGKPAIVDAADVAAPVEGAATVA